MLAIMFQIVGDDWRGVSNKAEIIWWLREKKEFWRENLKVGRI